MYYKMYYFNVISNIVENIVKINKIIIQGMQLSTHITQYMKYNEVVLLSVLEKEYIQYQLIFVKSNEYYRIHFIILFLWGKKPQKTSAYIYRKHFVDY